MGRRRRPESIPSGTPAPRSSSRGSQIAGLVGIVAIVGAAAYFGREGMVPASPERRNVLLVTIDTLRWDRLGSYGAPHGTTPVLDRLAARGARFETAVAHVPLTAPSHASILTGLTPLRHGVRDNGAYVLPASIPSLASTLRPAGYATAGFISGFPLDRRFGFANGFDAYDDRLPSAGASGRASYTERRADETSSRAIEWLQQRAAAAGSDPSPWFLWIHYFDPHAAYDPPPHWRGRMPTPYDDEVAFVDEQIGRVLGALRQIGAERSTVVAITADHGESLGEHGEETHGVFIYDSTLRVPLVLAGPGIAPGVVARVMARGVDVMPTLLDLAGVQAPTGIDGRSLRAALDGASMSEEAAYIESILPERHFGWSALRGLRDRRWKYIEAPEPELYDLRNDPREQTNAATEAPERISVLSRHLVAQVQGAATPDAERPRDAEASERLRSLGYAAGSRPAAAGSTTRRNPKTGIRLINRVEHAIAITRSDPRRAIGELRTVVAEDPGMAIARSQLALAFSSVGEHGAAIEQLRALIERGSASAEDLLLLSESYRAAGRTSDARDALRQAAALDPRSPEVALTEARSLMSARETEQAAAAFSRALTLAPDHPEALLGLGEIAMLRGDLSVASRHFERILARDPHDSKGRLRLGLLRGREGRMAEAIALLQPVVASSPANGEALAGFAAALARTGRAPEAVRYFERAVAAGQRTPAVLNGLGFARLESGDRSGALEALGQSLAADPNQPRVQQAVRDLSARGTPRPPGSRR